MAYLFLTRGVLDALGDSRVVTGSIPLQEIRLGDDVFTPLGPADFSLTLTNTGAGMVGAGRAAARFVTSCVRCLCEYVEDVSAEVDGFYVQPGDDADLPDEQEREYVVDDLIDLEPAIVQSVVLALPFAPVHSPDCKGICPTCGADLNEGACGCGPDLSASPFASLKDLLPDDGREPGESV